MDLLNSYGSSSSDSEDENDTKDERTEEPISKKPALAAAPSAKSTENRRGKKILSLAAVLPPHILDQLTKSQVNDGNLGDDSDDDSDSDYGEKKVKSRNNKSIKAVKGGIDKGISSFLSDLHAVPAAAVASQTKITKSQSTGNPIKKEKLGAAFLTSTVTTVKKNSEGVIDIHATTVASPTKEDYQSTGMESNAVSSEQAPATTTAASMTTSMFRRAPIQAAPRVTAAPRQRQQEQEQETQFVQQQQPSQPYQQPEPEMNSNAQQIQHQKKRSRKEMERALRQGNISVIDNNTSDGLLDIRHEEGHDGSQFVPDPEMYAAPPASAVRVAPTAMYDPSAGTTVKGIVGHKGKNQINQLMSAAASLEMQRARLPTNAATANKNPHRANAKRKYGW